MIFASYRFCAQKTAAYTGSGICGSDVQRGGREPDLRDMQEAENRDSTAAERVLPQRRWPRPPCMPSAVYRAGRWEKI